MSPKRARTRDLPQTGEAEPKTLDALNAMIAASKPLVPGATRAVLGEGPPGAAIAFVGEQPGDQEDRGGRHRSAPRLRHQCRQALQVRAARQAPHPPDTDTRRGQALPLVAGSGAET